MVGCFRCCFGVGVVVVVVFGDDGGMFSLLFWCWCWCCCEYGAFHYIGS